MSDVATQATQNAQAEQAPVLLAIDTAIGTSIALGADGQVWEAVSDDPRGHAEVIGTLLAEVFETAGIAPDRVTGVVAGIGPGPFTGLRVGITAAKTFAVARGVPLLPLQGHEAVALEELERRGAAPDGAATHVRVVQDARRKEFFVTDYAGLDEAGLPICSADARLVTQASYEASPADVLPTRIPAAQLVRLAERRIAAGRSFDSAEALYLRVPDVMQPTSPKRVVPGV